MTQTPEEFMRRAIELSRESVVHNLGGPFGAVIVRDGEVLAEGQNRVLVDSDPTAHAEVVAIRRACSTLQSFSLEGCQLYTSCEPCPMCLGSAWWARMDRIIYAAGREDAAGIGFDDLLFYAELAMDPPERSVPMDQLLRVEALEPLCIWDEKEDKTPF